MLRLATPLLLSNLAQVLLGVTDTLFAGQLGTVALAAAGIGSMFYFTLLLLPRGVVFSIVPFVSQAFGAKDDARVGRWFGNYLMLALLLSPIALLYLPVLGVLIGASGAESAVQAQALSYGQVRLLEIPFALLQTALIGFLIGTGDSKTPMLINWIAVILNVFLNWVFVFGNLGAPRLELLGAAVGSVLSVAIGSLIGLAIVYRKHAKGYGVRLIMPKRSEFMEQLRVGAPLGLMEMLEVSAFAAFIALTGRISTDALASSQIGNQVSSVAFMPGFALGNATASLVGRYLGAKDADTANRAAYTGVGLGIVWMMVMGALFWIFAEPLSRVFSSDPNVIGLTTALLRLMAFYQLFDAVNIVFRSALLGTGDTRFAALITLLTAWTVMVAGGYVIVSNGGGLIAAWLAPFAYLTLLAVVYWFRWRAGHWRTSNLGSSPVHA
jgi:multidrug resistance protein, MATE family